MKKKFVIVFIVTMVGFLIWRFIRPMNIFIVDERFAWPVDTSRVPKVLGQLKAQQCGACHPAFYKEWKTTIHSQAWIDPYFQADWQFDGSQDNCRLCHTPLDKQQPQTILAYRDADKWDPVLKNNPAFDPQLQHEGVTCAACHYRNGKIVGVLKNTHAPHPVKILKDPNQICVRCHVVEGKRWDTFFRFPPCGTVAEISATRKDVQKNKQLVNQKHPDNTTKRLTEKTVASLKSITHSSKTGELPVNNYKSLGCVQCHMPVVERPLVVGGKVRLTRHHYWRGGHDPAMVKNALDINFVEYQQADNTDKRIFRLTIINTGAEHYLPTGIPDRHLTVQFQLIDAKGSVLDEQGHTIKRTVMWRPFIIDLWDTRLRRWLPRHYDFIVDTNKLDNNTAEKVEATVKYHLLDEKHRQRINYKNKTAINYTIFQQQILLSASNTQK